MTFDEEVAQRESELEAARANKAADPETWDRVKHAYAEWRRGIRLLGGRPLGPEPMWTDDIKAFVAAQPQPETEG